MVSIKRLFKNYFLQREIIRKFREKGAFSVDFAKPLEELEIDKEGLRPVHMKIINKLIKNGVLTNAGNKTYFLDERALMRYRMNKTKWGVIILFLVIILFILQFMKK